MTHSTTPPPAKDRDDDCRVRRWFVYATLITISMALSAGAILNVEPLLSANDRSRWCTVWSLVERGSYEIDEIESDAAWSTIDKVRHEEHFYSSKPPLMSTLVAGVYWFVKHSSGWNLTDHTAPAARLVLLIVNILPMIVALVVVAKIVERYSKTDAARYFVLIVAGFGTLLTPFLVTLNNHTLAAASVLFALYPAMLIHVDGRREWRYFAACGFFAAFACCNELPAALFSVSMFVLLLRVDFKRTAAVFIPAALIPLAAFFVTNYLATGGILPFYTYYGTDKYVYVYEGVASYWNNPTGIDRGGDSPLAYFLHCTLGHHGVFSLSPVFLLTLVSWATLRQRRDFALREFLILGLGLSVAVLGFYLTRTANYNYGGNTAGLRWMFWLIPFWLIGLIPVVDEFCRKRWFQIVCCGLLSVSVFSAVAPISNPWRPPWMFTLMESWGWIDYREQHPPLSRKLWSIFPTLPAGDAGDAGDAEWIEFRSEAAFGTRQIWRFSHAGTQTNAEGTLLQRIRIDRTSGTQERSETVFIDARAFNAAKPPIDFVRWPDGAPARTQLIETLSFVGGLPGRKEYKPSSLRYLKTPLREDKFQCRRAAAGVRFRPSEDGPELYYRTELWLCPELPFGVARIILTVSDPKTDENLSQVILSVHGAGRYPKQTLLRSRLDGATGVLE